MQQLHENDKKLIQMQWIMNATSFFIRGLPCTQENIQAGTLHAVKVFCDGSSAANAIYQGYDHARKSIRIRQRAQFGRPLTMRYLKQ